MACTVVPSPFFVNQVVEVRHQLSHAKGVVRPKPAGQRGANRGQLATQPPPRQFRQDLRVRRALGKRRQHRPARDSEDIAGHRRELDAAILECLVQAIGDAGPILDERLAVTGKIAQLPNRDRRHKAAPEQPMLQELSDPYTVLDVGLSVNLCMERRRDKRAPLRVAALPASRASLFLPDLCRMVPGTRTAVAAAAPRPAPCYRSRASDSSSSKTFATRRSGVSNPSVNQP